MKIRAIICVTAALLIASLPMVQGCQTAAHLQGTVFEDSNANGLRDEAERGIADVVVSNGISVTSTDDSGSYGLEEGGLFVFMTTPRDYTATTTWYRPTEDHNIDFGLAYTPQRADPKFNFIQMTDIHLDTAADHLSMFEQALEEIEEIAPAFVIATGDLVNGADVVDASVATEWFEAYASLTSELDVPLYNALGNHDVVGIHFEPVASTEAGLNKATYQDYFGPTYYSFDWGGYHCLVLDPNETADSAQVYRIPALQLEWLKEDLARSEDQPLLVFFHEPTPSWQNRTDVLGVLGQHEASLFSGHWHQDTLLDSLGLREQVTGALCGEWWWGPCPDGAPQGYRIISIDEEGITSFYKGVGLQRQINIVSPNATVVGEAILVAQVYTEHGPLREVNCRVDGERLGVSVAEGELWHTAIARWNPEQPEAGYHTVVVEVTDENGTFSAQKELKVGDDRRVPIDELVKHFEVYQGDYTTVVGQVGIAAVGPPYASEGTGAILVSDETGTMVVIVGECLSPLPPSLASGDLVKVTAVPVKYTWGFVETSQEFELLQQYAPLVPEGCVVRDETGISELRLMRLPSGDGIRVLSPAVDKEAEGQ